MFLLIYNGIIQMGEFPHVVIVGAGFGGLRAARGLKDAAVKITVIDKSNHHLFQPLLYQVATAGLSPAQIAVPVRHILRAQKNADVLMAEVTGIDKEKKYVLMGERLLPYDVLVLATGARHSYFGRDDWEKFAPGLKSIEDAIAIRRKILLAFELAENEPDAEKRKALLTFILVGAGPTGVEMAGSIAELAHRVLASDFRRIDTKSARILLIEAADRILGPFPPGLSQKAQHALKKLGVEILLNTKVENIDGDGVVANGQRIFSKTVIWTAGVAASPAGKWLSIETDRAGRVKVQPDLTVLNHPEIFVLGDAAHVSGDDGKPLPGVAPVAMQEGDYVAEVIRTRVSGKTHASPFHYFDKGSLATVGRSFAIAKFRKISLSGLIAWFAWLLVHILYLIGFRNRLIVLFDWAWSYLTFQRGARLITFDEEGKVPTVQGDEGSS